MSIPHFNAFFSERAKLPNGKDYEPVEETAKRAIAAFKRRNEGLEPTHIFMDEREVPDGLTQAAGLPVEKVKTVRGAVGAGVWV